jgi:NADPH-dependent glutamate synthase beta subunit-like oxidoreductase
VAIKALKRFVSEREKAVRFKSIPVGKNTGKQIAVVGSGPAGLTAAYYLALLGHKVVIFEKLEKPGGMMRMGIPKSRLPRDILDKEIEGIKAAGVSIKTGIRIESLDDLFKSGFDALFLAVGSHKTAKRKGIADEENPPDYKIDRDSKDNLVISPQTLATGKKGVFAGGDAVTGQKSVIDAIAAGRKAAVSIDKYLGGAGNIEGESVYQEGFAATSVSGRQNAGKRVGFPVEPRHEADKVSGYDEQSAIEEAKRCLACDSPIKLEPEKCFGCLLCAMRCSYREGGVNPFLGSIIVERTGKSRFDRKILFKKDCDDCHLCVNICPSGALTIDPAQ